jgi:hypothetical protein
MQISTASPEVIKNYKHGLEDDENLRKGTEHCYTFGGSAQGLEPCWSVLSDV